MIEITRQVTGLAKKIDTIGDAVEIVEWANEIEDIYCTVSARADGTLTIELGGVNVESVAVQLGQWLVFDGERFSALSQEQFEAKGYSSEPTP